MIITTEKQDFFNGRDALVVHVKEWLKVQPLLLQNMALFFCTLKLGPCVIKRILLC